MPALVLAGGYALILVPLSLAQPALVYGGGVGMDAMTGALSSVVIFALYLGVLYLAVRWALYFQVAIAEDTGIRASLSRTAELTAGIRVRIAVAIIDPKAFNGPTEKALAAGIPVVSYNADDPANARLAYIGQDLYVSGQEMGKRIVELVDGGKVALFIATPGSLNIQPRIDGAIGIGGAAAVLFAVNVTAVVPATPSNIGVFQLAVISVLTTGYGVAAADALAYGVILQAVEIATAVGLGVPALVREGMSWSDVRLRALSAAPVRLRPEARADERIRA